MRRLPKCDGEPDDNRDRYIARLIKAGMEKAFTHFIGRMNIPICLTCVSFGIRPVIDSEVYSRFEQLPEEIQRYLLPMLNVRTVAEFTKSIDNLKKLLTNYPEIVDIDHVCMKRVNDIVELIELGFNQLERVSSSDIIDFAVECQNVFLIEHCKSRCLTIRDSHVEFAITSMKTGYIQFMTPKQLSLSIKKRIGAKMKTMSILGILASHFSAVSRHGTTKEQELTFCQMAKELILAGVPTAKAIDHSSFAQSVAFLKLPRV